MSDEEHTRVEVGPSGLKASGRELGPILLSICAGLLIALSFITYSHSQETREGNVELAKAMNNLARAINRQTCQQEFPRNPEACRRITAQQ